MDISIGQGLALKMEKNAWDRPRFPTTRLQKGLSLFDGDQELEEEGVGFGVPIVMRGLQTLFPGDVRMSVNMEGQYQVVKATYILNLIERIGRPDRESIENRLLYALKNYLAALIRELPMLRAFLTGISTVVRKLFRWETIYEPADICIEVGVTYKIDQQNADLEISLTTQDLSSTGVSEIIMMNEQGARSFYQYNDSSGVNLQGKEIGCWDEVKAQEASFSSPNHNVAFTLSQATGAKLFRGRELIGTRLAWAGFGYSFPPRLTDFCYQLKIRRLL